MNQNCQTIQSLLHVPVRIINISTMFVQCKTSLTINTVINTIFRLHRMYEVQTIERGVCPKVCQSLASCFALRLDGQMKLKNEVALNPVIGQSDV